jgi:hypothetical protein
LDDAAADVTLDIRQLASIYWGGVGATAVAGAGLITEHTPGAVKSLSRAFRSDRAPAVGRDF